jgi:cystathionine beta-lyase family protein involved in aluminum resistance
MENMQWVDDLDLPADLKTIIKNTCPAVEPEWKKIDRITLQNQSRVLEAFREERVAEEDFHESSGYGYDDAGREKFEKVYARIFCGDKALVRPHLISGTHTLSVALFGLLRPGDKLLSITGPPYDTLQMIIGKSDGREKAETGTLAEWGIKYDELPLDENGYPDLSHLQGKLSADVRVAFIQRSLGYNSSRVALTVEDIKNITAAIRKHRPDVAVLVDNCYGEFVETVEPLGEGADVLAGSLIKNPGGGLALTGGYLVGKAALVDRIADRLSAPGLGGHLGAMGTKRYLYMGLFNAPTLVGNALKSAVFAAKLFAYLGFDTRPAYDGKRGDTVQAITLEDAGLVELFCRTIQKYSPVGSYLAPLPSPVPGYTDPVIMAAGAFIQGASGELSADAPMREPFTVFLQGALTISHALIAICKAAEAVYMACHP